MISSWDHLLSLLSVPPTLHPVRRKKISKCGGYCDVLLTSSFRKKKLPQRLDFLWQLIWGTTGAFPDSKTTQVCPAAHLKTTT